MAARREEVLVIGAGATGRSVLRHLARTRARARLADTRPAPPEPAALHAEFPHVPVHCGELPGDIWARTAQVVLSPGVAPDASWPAAARAAGVEVVGDIELFARAARAPVIAVTGTNGKSTVTTLVAQLAGAAGVHARAGGNLGPPALDLLDGPLPDLYVLEISSFQLETTDSLRPVAAAVLNLTPDHLDRHGSLAAYAAAKARVLAHAGVAVLCRDDPGSSALAAQAPGKVRWFGTGTPAGAQDFGIRAHRGEPWLMRGAQPLAPRAALPLPGAHNAGNALAALALLDAAGVDLHRAAAALAHARGLAHRTELVGRAAGLDWYDDSKGTNVGATAAALAGLQERYPGAVVLIAGGLGKGQDFAPLRAAVSGAARAVVLIGTDAPRIAAALAQAVPLAHAPDMRAAVRAAAALAQAGDAVLLSPACASFDLFADYRARGKAFRAAVAALERGDG
jgi:UDP-N-acetylmuramoylalanine--D-glutamate ligase